MRGQKNGREDGKVVGFGRKTLLARALKEGKGVSQAKRGERMDTQKCSKETLETLNSLLRGELSAVETYEKALRALGANFNAKLELEICRGSHQLRVRRLREAISQLDGTPPLRSGAWGTFARFVAGGASLVSASLTLAALEEGEGHGLKKYRKGIPKLDLRARQMVAVELLPAQIRTHRTLNALRRANAHGHVQHATVLKNRQICP